MGSTLSQHFPILRAGGNTLSKRKEMVTLFINVFGSENISKVDQMRITRLFWQFKIS